MKEVREMNKFDPKYEAHGKELLEQLIGEGFSVEEIRLLLHICESNLENAVSELRLQRG